MIMTILIVLLVFAFLCLSLYMSSYFLVLFVWNVTYHTNHDSMS